MPSNIFRFPGGKSRVSHFIIKHFPAECEEIRIPFVGGGGVFWNVNCSKRRWINDINPHLMSVYLALRDRPDEFIAKCREIEPAKKGEPETYARENGKKRKKYNERLKKVFDSLKYNEDADLALRYFFLNRTIWAGRVNFDPKMESRMYFSNPEGWNIVKTNKPEKAAKILQGVQITVGDYKSLLDAPGSNVLIYCFLPGSLVRTMDEKMILIEDIEAGNKLWSNRTVLNTVKRHYNGSIYNIKIQGSPYILRVTSEHPVLMIPSRPKNTRQEKRNKNELASAITLRSASTLKEGDYLCIPVGGPEKKEWDWNFEESYSEKIGFRSHHKIKYCPDDESIGELIGLYAAEGSKMSIQKGITYSVSFAFNKNEQELINKTRDIISKVFGIASSIYSPHDSVKCVSVHSRAVSNFLTKWILGTAINKDKRLNHTLMTAPITIQKKVLQGWLNGDRGLRLDRKGTKAKLTGTSVSKILALQMYHIALRCGFRPSFRIRINKNRQFPGLSRNGKIYCKGRKEKGELICYDVYLSICSEIENLGYKTKAKRNCATRRIVNGFCLSRIKQIQQIEYCGDVHNLHVDGDNLVCVDNVVSHNCDAPYYRETKLTRTDKLYEYGFSEEDHIRFAENLKECPHQWCLSYDDDPFIRKLFKDFYIHEASWVYCGSSLDKKKTGQELIITNYKAHIKDRCRIL